MGKFTTTPRMCSGLLSAAVCSDSLRKLRVMEAWVKPQQLLSRLVFQEQLAASVASLLCACLVQMWASLLPMRLLITEMSLQYLSDVDSPQAVIFCMDEAGLGYPLQLFGSL